MVLLAAPLGVGVSLAGGGSWLSGVVPSSRAEAAPRVVSVSISSRAVLAVRFSERVRAKKASFAFACPASRKAMFALSVSPAASFTLRPSRSIPVGTLCRITVRAKAVHDVDRKDPPDTMRQNFVRSVRVPRSNPPPTTTTTTTTAPPTTPTTSTTTTTTSTSTATTTVPTTTTTPVDVAPTAVDDAATVAEDSGATGIDVLANDSDPDGGPRSVIATTNAAHGAVAITGGGARLTYRPRANYCNDPPGTSLETFTYTLNGGSTATVTVSVGCVDDDPEAGDLTTTVAENSGANEIDVLGNAVFDPDGGPKSIIATTNGTHGTVQITGGGAGLSYTPDADYCNDPPGTSPEMFPYTLNGGSTATVTVYVSCADVAPTAVDDAATVAEDSGTTPIDVLANDTDPDGGPKSIIGYNDGAHGTVAITGGGAGLSYTPDPNYCNDPPGTSLETFTYILNGGSTATVTVTVTCVEDDPTAADDAAIVAEDSGPTPIDVLANDTDPDGDPNPITATMDGAHGTVAITGSGAGLSYAPDLNYCNAPPGTSLDTFTYTLSGGSTATVTVKVTCVEDEP